MARETLFIDEEACRKLPSQFDPVQDIADFHEKFGLEYKGPPRLLEPAELADFREQFMEEELIEYKEAIMDAEHRMTQFTLWLTHPEARELEFTRDLERALDSLVDLVYVTLGTAYLHGFDFREAWRRVHQKNMAKVRVERIEDSKRGSTFDVVKPPDWTPPVHRDLVENHAHKEHFRPPAP